MRHRSVAGFTGWMDERRGTLRRGRAQMSPTAVPARRREPRCRAACRQVHHDRQHCRRTRRYKSSQPDVASIWGDGKTAAADGS